MNIGIDGYEANFLKRVGVGQYAYHLLHALSATDSHNNYFIFLPSVPQKDMPPETEHWHYCSGRPGKLWTLTQLPRLIRRVNLDIFFSPTHYIPWFVNMPRLFSIMDLAYIHFPHLFKTKDLIQLRYMTLFSIKRARKIFTISEFSKREIIEHYKYPEDDIIVTYPGNYFSQFQVPPGRKQMQNMDLTHGITKPFILFVGTLQPRKNLERLIEAFEHLEKDMQLVIVGKKGWLYEGIMQKARESWRKRDIVYLDYITTQHLSDLYANAICLVLPSLYEGFGMPVLEAMGFGCPVVVSQNSSLPEIAGDLGIYINPLDTQSIAQGLAKAIKLTQAERISVAEKSIKRAQNFSWKRSAEIILAVFKETENYDK